MTALAFLMLSVMTVVGLLMTIAFMTLIERKLISATQNSKGPNVVGTFGMLQPFADALKLVMKESMFPRNARLFVFILAPLSSLFFALVAWAFMPITFNARLVDVNLGLFFIFACSILHVYGVMLAGWASGSRYSFLGSIRSTAQLVAYDMSMGISVCCVVAYTGSLNLADIVEFQQEVGWLVFYLPGLFVIFFMACLAETNSHPFDLPEAESELVGGYTTEYSSAYFAFFFLGEYCSILVMVFLMNHLFLGGWNGWDGGLNASFFLYALKVLVIYYVFIFVRAAIPRYRYDQLMRLGWKFIIPLLLGMFVLVVFSKLIVLHVQTPQELLSSLIYIVCYVLRAFFWTSYFDPHTIISYLEKHELL